MNKIFTEFVPAAFPGLESECFYNVIPIPVKDWSPNKNAGK